MKSYLNDNFKYFTSFFALGQNFFIPHTASPASAVLAFWLTPLVPYMCWWNTWKLPREANFSRITLTLSNFELENVLYSILVKIQKFLDWYNFLRHVWYQTKSSVGLEKYQTRHFKSSKPAKAGAVPTSGLAKSWVQIVLEWTFVSGQHGMSRNGVFSPLRLEWIVHFNLAGMEWSHSIPAGMNEHSIPARMEWPLHSCRNGLSFRS